jgi:hypothetical protein
LNNLFYDELNKRKAPDHDDTAESSGSKQLKVEEGTTGHKSLLSGLL